MWPVRSAGDSSQRGESLDHRPQQVTNEVQHARSTDDHHEGAREALDDSGGLLSPLGYTGSVPSRYDRNEYISSPSESPYGSIRIPSPANASARRQDLGDNAPRDPIGLTVVHEPGGPLSADLVFVHSPGGGSIRSWSDDGRRGTFWPVEWLAREDLLESARISTYGYSSHGMDPDRLLDLSDIAKDLLAKLRFGNSRNGRAPDIGSVPLIFVAHSLGGLIAKKAYHLASSDPNHSEIADATKAFVFFSTPHRGLQKHTVNNILLACMPGWRTAQNGDLVNRIVPRLQDINEKFRDHATRLDIYSFYARRTAEPSYGGLPLPQQLNTLDHACEIAVPLDVNHSTITRFPSRDDPDYASVRGALRELLEKFQSRRKLPVQEDTVMHAGRVNLLLKGCGSPEQDHSFYAERRSDGSCQWVLTDPTMESFLASEESSPQILWCYGGPGSGKSVIATFLIDYLVDQSKPCAYYYFRAGNQDKNNLGKFLTSLALQISQYSPEYRRKLSVLAAEHFDIGKAGHRLLWKELFVVALLQCRPERPLYIVIDGLDELAPSRELLQKMLVDLGESRSHLRLLIVSRPTVEIETSIERLAKRMQVSRMALDRNNADLALYVRDEMEVMMGDDEFKENIVEQVLAKAGQNFLWAHLVVKEILDCQTEIQVESALQQVPKELEPLYERMDRRIAELLRTRPQDRAMGHTIITWAACSRRPLHLNEIQTALEYDFPRIMDMGQTIQKLCGEFVDVDKKGHVSMMHASAREFLMSNPRLNYYIRTKDANHKIYTRCIAALIKSRRDYDSLDEQPKAFLLYAASSWPFHLTQSSDYGDLESLTLILRFLETDAILNWMFLLASAGSLRVVVEASKALTKLLKTIDRTDRERSPLAHRIEDKHTINLWSQDLIRIVGRFGPQIIGQPRTVYELVPPFCPKGSIMYKKFGQRRGTRDRPPLSIRGRLNVAWDDCFAKFSIPGEILPFAIKSLDRYFAILTKDNGIVHLHYSSTCEAARQFDHGAMVLAWCVDPSITRIATYGVSMTKVWDIESGRLLWSIINSRRIRALAISFQRSPRGEDLLFTLSNDRIVRSCSLDDLQIAWKDRGAGLDEELARTFQVNSPHNAQFSADGLYLAISYRGAYPSVWSLGSPLPRFVRYCEHRGRRNSNIHHHEKTSYVVDFAWNSLTGHLLGAFNDGIIFRWHPKDDDFLLSRSEFKSTIVKCSTDGKLVVTGSGGGSLLIWDFEHFTPIYELQHPVGGLKDLDIGWNDARIYDIREQYCNIWEPSSLLRALESDESQSDTHSTQDGERPTPIQDAHDTQGYFEPVTACVVMDDSARYAKGNDSGQITICDFDGKILLELAERDMSIEKLAWSSNGAVLAVLDLGREIKVWKIEVDAEEQRLATPELLRSLSEAEEILQVLLNVSGQYLLLTTPEHVKVHDVSKRALSTVVIEHHSSRWVTHPRDDQFVLGFGRSQVVIASWNDPAHRSMFTYEGAHGSVEDWPPLSNSRRPSQTYPTIPSEVNETVNKVLTSSSSALVLVEIFGSTKQRRQRMHCLLLDSDHLRVDGKSTTVPVCSITSKLAECLYVSLGFIDPRYFAPTLRRPSAFEHRRSVAQRRLDLSTFAFVSTEFWVCSVDVGIGQKEEDQQIRKHFFLPRDWQNTEWLEMAKVTPWGDFLCPRNGEIAVVTNGFTEDFSEWN